MTKTYYCPNCGESQDSTSAVLVERKSKVEYKCRYCSNIETFNKPSSRGTDWWSLSYRGHSLTIHGGEVRCGRCGITAIEEVPDGVDKTTLTLYAAYVMRGVGCDRKF